MEKCHPVDITPFSDRHIEPKARKYQWDNIHTHSFYDPFPLSLFLYIASAIPLPFFEREGMSKWYSLTVPTWKVYQTWMMWPHPVIYVWNSEDGLWQLTGSVFSDSPISSIAVTSCPVHTWPNHKCCLPLLWLLVVRYDEFWYQSTMEEILNTLANFPLMPHPIWINIGLIINMFKHFYVYFMMRRWMFILWRWNI